jgi:hypothetical protein
LNKDDILKTKIYDTKKKEYIMVINKNCFNSLNKILKKKKIKFLNSKDKNSRRIIVKHVHVELKQNELIYYFKEIGKVSIIKKKKNKKKCFLCKQSCVKYIIEFCEFDQVLKSMDYHGATIHAFPIFIIPKFLKNETF